MRDRVCPIEECAATVRFDEAVVEVTPRYRLHDLDEVDEFASCPECGAAIAGFHPEDGEDEGEVELILDIDDEDDPGGDGADDGGDGASEDVVDDAGVGEAVDDGGFDAPADDFDDPDDVLTDADGEAAIGDDTGSDGDDEAYEPVFGSSEDE
jgi:hypothetical protein